MDMNVVSQIGNLVAQAVANNPGIAEAIKAQDWSAHASSPARNGVIDALMNTAEMQQAKALASSQGWWAGVGGGGGAGFILGGFGGAGVVWDPSGSGAKRGVWLGAGSLGLQVGGGVYVICFLAPDIGKWEGFTTGGFAHIGLVAGVGIMGLSQGVGPSDGLMLFVGLEAGVGIGGLIGGRGTFDA